MESNDDTQNIPKKQGDFVRDIALAERYDVSRATVWRWVHDRGFPAPVRLSEQCTRWRLADVVKWEKRQDRGT